MARGACALGIEQRLATGGVANHRRGANRRRARAQVGDDLRRLLLAHLSRGHRRVGNAGPDGANEIGVGHRSPEPPASEVDALNLIAIGSVAVGAARLEGALAVQQVGGGFVLRVGRVPRTGPSEYREQHREANRHVAHAFEILTYGRAASASISTTNRFSGSRTI